MAKFSFFRNRQLVRLQAPKKLKRFNIAVNEQFPTEIEKRKTLYPVMRTARLNGHRVNLVRKSLYIYGRLYVPPALGKDDSDQAKHRTEHKTDYASMTKVGINTTPKASKVKDTVRYILVLQC